MRILDVKKINKKLRISSVISLVLFIILVLYNNADMLIHAVLPVSVAVIVVLVGLWKTRSNKYTKLPRGD